MDKQRNGFAIAAPDNPPVTQSDPFGGSDDGYILDFERYWVEINVLRFWLMGIFGACFFLAIAATLLTTPRYASNARIEISQIAANVTDIDPLDSTASVSELQYLNTQYELLESRFMATRVANEGGLFRDEEFLQAFSIGEEDQFDENDLADLLGDNLEIEGINQSSLVDIVFTSPSPTLSARIANLWAEQFIAANYEKRFGANIEAREYLSAQIAELREVLAQAE